MAIPTKYKAVLKALEKDVGTMGVNKSHLIKKYKLPANFFKMHTEAMTAYDKGYALFTEMLMGKTVDSLSDLGSASTLKYLMDKTKVFDGELKLAKMKDAKTALANLSTATNAYMLGHITEKQLQNVRSAVMAYSEISVNVDLQLRIENIEKMLNEKK